MTFLSRLLRFCKGVFIYLIFGDRVNATLYESRLSICNSCKYKTGNTCGVCGCRLQYKAKWSTEKCPENKW